MSLKKEIILHVGMPKTGSSALQTYLFEHKSKIQSQGFCYPKDVLPTAMPKHQSIVRDLLSNNLSQLHNFCTQSGKKGLILSTEGLTNHLYDISENSFQAFREITSNFHLTVFIVLRDKATWLPSYYTQAVLNPHVGIVDFYATALTLDEFSQHPRISKLLNHKDLLKDVKKAYGASKIEVAHYEDNWFKRFKEASSLQFDDDSLTKKVNESPEPWSIELMRQINSFKLPEPQRNVWKATLHKYSNSNHTLLKKSEKNLAHNQSSIDTSLLKKIKASPEEGRFVLTNDKLQEFSEYIYSVYS